MHSTDLSSPDTTLSHAFFLFIILLRPPGSPQGYSSAASAVYKRQRHDLVDAVFALGGDDLLMIWPPNTPPSPRDRQKARMPTSA